MKKVAIIIAVVAAFLMGVGKVSADQYWFYNTQNQSSSPFNIGPFIPPATSHLPFGTMVEEMINSSDAAGCTWVAGDSYLPIAPPASYGYVAMWTDYERMAPCGYLEGNTVFQLIYRLCPDDQELNTTTGGCGVCELPNELINGVCTTPPDCPEGQHDEGGECICDWETYESLAGCEACSSEAPGVSVNLDADDVTTESKCMNGCLMGYEYSTPYLDGGMTVQYSMTGMTCTVEQPPFPINNEGPYEEEPITPETPIEDQPPEPTTTTETTTTEVVNDPYGEGGTEETTTTTTYTDTGYQEETVTTYTTSSGDVITTTEVVDYGSGILGEEYPDVPEDNNNRFDSMLDGIEDELLSGMGQDDPGSPGFNHPLEGFTTGACQAMTIGIPGVYTFSFPDSTGCLWLGRLKTLLEWVLYIVTAVTVVRIALARVQ